MKNHSAHALRKAAILVASLDVDTADALLDQMPEEEAGQVRRLMVELGDVPDNEQQEVIGDFLGIGPLAARGAAPRVELGVELDEGLARRLEQDRAAAAATNRVDSGAKSNAPPFRFLHEAPGEKLSPLIEGEHPQTIALVVSHLPPDRAASVLATLPSPVQADVIRRLVDLDEADPGILREVERGLESRILEQVRTERRQAAGLAAVTNILEAASPRLKREFLANLSLHDRPLANKLAPPRLEFDLLEQLAGTDLALLLAAAEPQLIVLALAGATVAFVEQALAQFAPSEARAVRRALQNLGPTRLSDVEEAQRSLVRLAQQMEAEGRIDLPRSTSLATAR